LKTENAFIETSQAIEQIVKVECGYLYDDTYVGDITQYVYSSTEYNGLLSSTEDAYPLSKAYAIYYGQGQKNIYGLNFKLPGAIHPIFEDYSIINIINKVTGGNYKSQDIMKLQFRVTYIPRLNLRVRQHKTNVDDLNKPVALNFNQSAQKVSAQNYGNAIRGALAKLGNPEKTLSYIFTGYPQMPHCGYKCGDDYYISIVSTEFYGSFYKCNVSLSKNYNRKDRYISLNNNIRLYEVSEQQAVDRQVYYEDVCIIGNKTETTLTPEKYPRITPKALEEIASSFGTHVSQKITAVNSKSYDKNKEIIAQYLMPVTSLGIGNSLLMHWEYVDNYTSGTAVTEESGSRLQKQQPYADIYGEIKYLGFDLGKIDFEAKNSVSTGPYDYDRSVKIGDNLPKPIDMHITGKDGQPYFSTDRYPYPYGTEIIDSNLIVLNKDSREIISFNYQINFVTNDNIIIGNELAKSSPFATTRDADYKLYVWYGVSSTYKDSPIIHKLADELDLSNAVEIGKVSATVVNDPTKQQIKIDNILSETLMENNPLPYGKDFGWIKAWAIVNNGKLVFGKNTVYPSSEPVTKDLVMPYLTFEHII
jgi:hypothetical protein